MVLTINHTAIRTYVTKYHTRKYSFLLDKEGLQELIEQDIGITNDIILTIPKLIATWLLKEKNISLWSELKSLWFMGYWDLLSKWHLDILVQKNRSSEDFAQEIAEALIHWLSREIKEKYKNLSYHAETDPVKKVHNYREKQHLKKWKTHYVCPALWAILMEILQWKPRFFMQ